MRRFVLLVVAVLFPQLFARPAAAQAPIARIAWLSGCWARTNGRALIEENWMPARGGIMLGVGRTTRGDTLREFEFTRIFMAGDTLVFGALPSGQNYAEFRALNATRDEVVFENLAHDFPQRVAYRRAGADSLLAYIEGKQGAETVRVNFAYARVSCEHGMSR